VLATLWEAGHGAYLVGGGVRDAFLGLDISDWDVATDARPERILGIFPGSAYQNRFGTVLARGLEITTFRRDHRYADHRRPDSITFSQDIYEDLARRDLTINAIAWGRRGPDAATRLIDPADGQGDLDARLVRAVGDPGRRFDEDALRLLRAVRIAARLDFAIEPLTKRAMLAHAADIEWVSEERIGSELRRMLHAGAPSRAVRLMRETGILATTLPELDGLTTAALDDTLVGLDAVAAGQPDNERLALAALLGDIGPETARITLARLRVGGRDIDAICALIAAAPDPYDPNWSDPAVRRYMGRVHPELLDDLLALRAARSSTDEGAARETELARRIAAQRAADSPLTIAELAIDGRDLRETLGIPEGPTIGAILERLLTDVIEEPSLNTRLTLLTRASLILDELVQAGRSGADRPTIR
jgi:tRNA nucleotidyltransferase (CCA-adding enzyme)